MFQDSEPKQISVHSAAPPQLLLQLPAPPPHDDDSSDDDQDQKEEVLGPCGFRHASLLKLGEKSEHWFNQNRPILIVLPAEKKDSEEVWFAEVVEIVDSDLEEFIPEDERLQGDVVVEYYEVNKDDKLKLRAGKRFPVYFDSIMGSVDALPKDSSARLNLNKYIRSKFL
jgi:hypothetical protein